MKKIITSIALSAIAMNVAADQILPTVAVTEVAVEEETVSGCSFDGLFFGAGIGGSFLKNNLNGSLDNKNNISPISKKQNVNRFLGSVLVGGGKVFNDTFYVGIEGLVDFTKAKKKHLLSLVDSKYSVDSKDDRFVPSIGLRFGLVKCDWNSMLYFRIAGSRARSSIYINDAKQGSVSKIVPSFTIGMEKMFSNKISSRVEIEYKLSGKKKESYTLETGVIAKDANFKAGKGFTIRALISYNVKI